MWAYFHRYRCLDPFAAFTPDGTKAEFHNQNDG